jgi:Na+(H+)/acetate symporter ActP
MNEKLQLRIIRGLVALFIIISAAIAIIQYKSSITFIAQLMGISWGALAGSFLAPFLYGLYWKKTSKASVWCGFIFSTSLMTLNIFFRGSFPPLLRLGMKHSPLMSLIPPA